MLAVSVVVDQQQGVPVVVVGVVAENLLSVGLPEYIGHQDLLGATSGYETPVQDQDAAAVPGLVEVVGGKDDDTSGIAFGFHHAEDPFLADQVETGDGFIQKQDVGLSCQRLCHQHPLALAE